MIMQGTDNAGNYTQVRCGEYFCLNEMILNERFRRIDLNGQMLFLNTNSKFFSLL